MAYSLFTTTKSNKNQSKQGRKTNKTAQDADHEKATFQLMTRCKMTVAELTNIIPFKIVDEEWENMQKFWNVPKKKKKNLKTELSHNIAQIR